MKHHDGSHSIRETCECVEIRSGITNSESGCHKVRLPLGLHYALSSELHLVTTVTGHLERVVDLSKEALVRFLVRFLA